MKTIKGTFCTVLIISWFLLLYFTIFKRWTSSFIFWRNILIYTAFPVLLITISLIIKIVKDK